MQREVITKLDAARRQLELAMRLYFDFGDRVAIQTLAGAAREIFEKHCALENRHRMFDQLKLCNPAMRDGEIWDVLNGPRNFFKHPAPDGDLQATVELGDDDNKLTLFIAAYDCTSLLGDKAPPMFVAYTSWYAATMPHYRPHLPELDVWFPGLHEAPEAKQRVAGKALVVLRTDGAW